MTRIRVYLVVSADRSTRLLKRLPWEIAKDELVVPIDLLFPDTWGRVTSPLTVTLPDSAPTAEVAR